MILPLALALQVLLAAEDGCYFVGNTRLLSLPSCAISPTSIAELTEDPAPSSASSSQRRQGAVRGAGTVRPTIVVRGNEELERRLEIAQQERIDAVAQRLDAESRLEVALRQRDAAVHELAAARRELAELRGRLGPEERGDEAGRRAVEATN